MGSVVGACYASGITIDKMQTIVKKLKFSDIFDLSLNPIGNGALLRSQKMRRQLEKHLGKLKFSDLKIPFSCVATDMIRRALPAFRAAMNDYEKEEKING